MKIHIQYPSNQANPAVVAVETDDSGLTTDEALKHASDALNLALKTVWGDKAQTFKYGDFEGTISVPRASGKTIHLQTLGDASEISKAIAKEFYSEQKREIVKDKKPLPMLVATKKSRLDTLQKIGSYFFTHNVTVEQAQELVTNPQKAYDEALAAVEDAARKHFVRETGRKWQDHHNNLVVEDGEVVVDKDGKPLYKSAE